MRRTVEHEREARRHSKAAAAAGRSAGEWAREHGIDGRSLNAWRINLARSASSEVAPLPLSERSAARYLVRIRDVVIELGPDFDDENHLTTATRR
jgi:hypothetical protein